MTGNKTDILIIGAGVPGLTLAILLGQLGITVSIIDPYPPNPAFSENDTRTSALMKPSLNILGATGVLEMCKDQSGVMDKLRIIDDTKPANDQADITFHAHEINQDIFGLNIPNNVLRTTLFEIAQNTSSVTCHIPGKLSSYKADEWGVTAKLEDGTEIKSGLIVGADGRNSLTREIANISCHEKDYGQVAITCFINHEISHEETSTEFHRSGGPFTLVPLPKNLSSIVWVEYKDNAESFMNLSENDFEKALQERTKNIWGEISVVKPPQSWSLKSLHANALTAPRTALIAEAAHVLHPLGAQGLNLSLRDTADLAETIADALRTGMDPGSNAILHRYDKKRQTDITGRVKGTDLLNRIITADLPLVSQARTVGLKTLDTVSPLKNAIMRYGMAPQKEQDRLANGRPL